MEAGAVDYPRMLYRPGTELRVWDLHDVDTKLVGNETEELEALEDGWSRNPDHKPKKPVLKAKEAPNG